MNFSPLAGVIFFCLLVFVFDLYTPLGVAVGYLYIPALVFISFQRKLTLLYSAFTIALSLTITGAIIGFFRSDEVNQAAWLINRVAAAAMLLLFLFFLQRVIKQLARLQNDKQIVDRVIDIASLDVILIDLNKNLVHLLSGSGAFSLFRVQKSQPLKVYLKCLGKNNAKTFYQLLTNIGNQEQFDFTSDFLHTNADEHWYRMQGVKTKNNQYHCIVQNISFTSGTNLENNNFTGILDLLPCFAWTAIPNGEIDYVNKKLLSSTQYSEQELIHNWPEYLHKDDSLQLQKDWALAIKNKTKLNYSIKFRRKEGSYIHSINEISPIFDENNNLIKWIGFGLDISDLEDLRRQKFMLNNIVDETKDSAMIYELNENTQAFEINYVNKAFEELTGYKRSEIIKRDPNSLITITSSPLNTAQNSKFEQPKAGFSGEAQLKTKKAESVTVELYTLALDDDEADLKKSFVTILQDKTQEKNLENIMARNNRMDSIGNLTGGIAHDFNNLLAVISGNLELAKLEALNSESKQLLDNALSAAKQGASLTSSLLQFARGERNDNTEQCAVSSLLTDQIALFTSINKENPIQFEANIEPNLHAFVSASQLESIVINLLNNARDAMQDSQNAKICISAKKVKLDEVQATLLNCDKGSYVRISISDNGCGMTEQQQQSVFAPFYSTKTKTKGTGLGLSMVYAYVRQNKGVIDLSSRVNQGTTFTLLLKWAETSMQNEGYIQRPAHENRYDNKCALIIEDKPRVAEVAKRHLESFGFTCTIFIRAEQALENVTEQSQVDLIFTDIDLPGDLNGYTLSKKLIEILGAKPVIYVSGLFDEKLSKEAVVGSAKLEKPYTRDSLAIALQQVMHD